MNEEMMTTGFTGASDPKGPTAGFDPVMKFRKKIAKRKKQVKENIEMKNGLFQYKVTVPDLGETIVYANNPSELRQKLRLLINYRYRGDIKIERIMPANAAKFFMDKRAKHLRNEEVQLEAKVDKGRSDYGKASIRNYRRSGPGHGEPAMFDPENKRGKTIDKRREEHKARRGVKGAKVPTYKKEEFELEEERSARKMNVRTKKTIQTTIAKNAAAEAKRKEKKTGEYKETPKKKPKLGLGYKTVVKHAQAKKAAAKTPITRATAKKAEKKTAPSTKSDARTKAQYKGKGAPGLDAHKERIAKHEAKRGVKKPKAAKKTPVTKATTTKPAPKKAPARKSVTSTPITKAASTPKKKKTFGDFVKDGVKRHKKATQGARVFGKGFAKGVKKSVKFAKDVKKVVTNEQVNKISKMVKAIRRKKEVLKQPSKSSYVGKRDAGAIAAKKMRDKEHNKYVNFLGADD